MTETQETELTKDEQFFYEHAGYSYDPATETRGQGRARCARELASAERWGRDNDVTFRWEDDWGLLGTHAEEYCTEAYPDGEPTTCEACIAYDRHNEVVASLGCIDDADDNYRRVIEAELASEVRYRATG